MTGACSANALASLGRDSLPETNQGTASLVDPFKSGGLLTRERVGRQSQWMVTDKGKLFA